MITERQQKGKINEKILVEALAQGKTKAEAGRLAGSKSKNPTDTVNDAIQRNPSIMIKKEELERDIINELKGKRLELIDKMTGDKADKSSYTQLATSMAIITDKIQLLENKPTSIMEIAPKMVFDGDTVEFKRLSQTEQKQLAPVEEGITKDISADDGL